MFGRWIGKSVDEGAMLGNVDVEGKSADLVDSDFLLISMNS